MSISRLREFRPSLRRWTRALAAAWLIGAALLAPVAMNLLEQIHNDAQSTYTKEIPSLLDRDRKALKLERLSSFINVLTAAQDPRVERHVLLQFQALAQGFDLDNDPALNELVARIVADVRRVIALHAAVRRSAMEERDVDGTKLSVSRASKEDNARKISEEAVAALNSAADRLTTGSALTADNLANRIQQNASWIKRGSLAALAIVVLSGVIFLWFFYHHVLAPIRVAVHGLELVRGSADVPVELPRALFFELDVIGRAVEQYARFAAELRTANLNLQKLSSQDGLTGVANRRWFDVALREACREVVTGARSRSLLLVDIDHFKSLNDRFGHQVGDRCLLQVAQILQAVCALRGGSVSRYGGEEFAILVADLDHDSMGLFAEEVREAVEYARLDVETSDCPLNVTISVGAALIDPSEGCTPERAIASTDHALYQAKRDGRNRVRLARPHNPSTIGTRTAA